MSRNRFVLSRPRTKVYDANYNMGEKYYKSALDGIDRKYGRSNISESSGIAGALRASLDREREKTTDSAPRRSEVRKDFEGDEFFDDFNGKKSKLSAALGEFDSIFESRTKNGIQGGMSRAAKALEEEFDEDLSASMKRLRAMKTARFAADEAEEIDGGSCSKRSDRGSRSKFDFSEKVMESVGLAGTSWATPADGEASAGKRRAAKMAATEASEGENLMRWTALKSGQIRKQTLDNEELEPAESAAASRARKSRARLDDLEAEIQAIAERGAAREKRARDLKALVQENETSSMENLHSTLRIKNAIHSEKKMVSF